MERRSFLAGIGLVGLGAVAGAAVGYEVEPALASESPVARTASVARGPGGVAATVTFRAAPSEPVVALTIDDGPTAKWTPQVLAILQRHGVVATFFLVGRRLAADPISAQRAAGAGHELGNHTWAHSDLTHYNATFVRDSLARTHEEIERATGRVPVLCRPPYGRIDSVGLGVCAALGYGVAMWSSHVTGAYAEGDVTRVLRDISPGSVVLSHDGGPEPNNALMRQLDRLVGSLIDDGYRFTTLSTLLSGSVTR